MFISKYGPADSWTQTLARKVTRPVFPHLPAPVRPYLLALTLFAAAAALMTVGDTGWLHLRFSMPLVFLLVIAAAAGLWGVRPAVLVLSLSVLYGVFVIPHWQKLPPVPPPHSWHMQILPTLLFVTCGAAAVWLTFRARLMQDKAETSRQVIQTLQSTVLPTALAEATGYDLCGLNKPAHHEEEVGGDFYDFYPTGTGQYCLLIGDVMGKGKEAAATTAFLRYSIRAFCSAGAEPAQIIRQLNTLIESQGLPFETASLFVGLLAPRSGVLRYANAGHEPPLLRGAEGQEQVLACTGPILGVGLQAAYDEEEVTLGHRDTLLLMTDGVTEARNKHGEFLGSAGTWWMLRNALRAPTAQSALATLDETLTDYIGTRRCDDIAMLLLQRR